MREPSMTYVASVQITIGDKYYLEKKIGSGAFGDIYLAVNKKTNEYVAVKLEHTKAKQLLVINEARLMKILSRSDFVGFPQVRWYGVEGEYNCLVMDLLGHSLEQLLVKCGGRFSLKTVLMIADQLLKRIECIHSKSYLHRDIKPDVSA